LLKWKEETLESAKKHLQKISQILSGAPKEFSKEKIKETLWEYAEKEGKGGVLWPMRVALTGLPKSPDPFSVAEILGKEETIKRLENATNKI
jgi:glutamyl/glutaminyl-tRNA synthetase